MQKGRKSIYECQSTSFICSTPINEARSCIKHFLSFSLPVFLRKGESGGSWWPEISSSCRARNAASPGNAVCAGVKHVREGTWGMSRELPKGCSEDRAVKGHPVNEL